MEVDKLMEKELGLEDFELDVFKLIYKSGKEVDVIYLSEIIKKDRSSVQRVISKLVKLNLVERQKVKLPKGWKYIYSIDYNMMDDFKKGVCNKLNTDAMNMIKKVHDW